MTEDGVLNADAKARVLQPRPRGSSRGVFPTTTPISERPAAAVMTSGIFHEYLYDVRKVDMAAILRVLLE